MLQSSPAKVRTTKPRASKPAKAQRELRFTDLKCFTKGFTGVTEEQLANALKALCE